MGELTFTRRAAGWYRARGAHHLYSISKDGKLWSLSILHEDTRPISRHLYGTLTDAEDVAGEFEESASTTGDA